MVRSKLSLEKVSSLDGTRAFGVLNGEFDGVMQAAAAIKACIKARSEAVEKLFDAMPSHIECWRCGHRTARFVDVVVEGYSADLRYYCDGCGDGGKPATITVWHDLIEGKGKWGPSSALSQHEQPPPSPSK